MNVKREPVVNFSVYFCVDDVEGDGSVSGGDGEDDIVGNGVQLVKIEK